MTRERDENIDFAARVDFPYWDGLAAGRLQVQRCETCARWQWPADWRCPGCGSYDLGWPEVEATGVVYSWIRTHYPFVPGYEDELPYVSLLVELPQAGGARVLGHLRDATRPPRIGDPVTGLFEAATPVTHDLATLRWRLVEDAL
jgi:uncharacterized OB-fold protein